MDPDSTREPSVLTITVRAHSSSAVRRAVLLLLTAILMADSTGQEPSAEQSESHRMTPRPGAKEDAAHAAPGDWTLPGRDHAGTRFSPLDQITPENVIHLKVAWTFSTGETSGHEGNPLVVDSTMYVVTPFPNKLYALDLTQEGAPLKWVYKPEPEEASQGVACCDVVNRGASYAAGMIIYNTLDNHTVAVDTKTGHEVWKAKLGEITQGQTMTMAPLVVKDKVIVGNSGAELGVRGWIAALELGTGKLLWRAYSTGPDADVKIGEAFAPFYADHRARDLGTTTWPGEQWKLGGGTVWGWVTYDPTLDLIYYGTGNPGVWNPDMRPGDNKWATSVFARNPDTGEAHWAYQVTPHDMWDFDEVNEGILVDLPIGGRTRKVMARLGRNGFGYTIDRATGEVLVAKPFATGVNWATAVNLQTGRPAPVADKQTREGVNVLNICPAAIGGKDQQPGAYSPRTHLLYAGINNACMDYKAAEVNYIAGTPYVGADVKMYAGPGGHRGEFIAWDPAQGTRRWSIEEEFPVWSGALTTATDVVFYGTMDGWFKAVGARDGKLLWKFKLGSGTVGAPMSYLGPDGKQYVAIYAGVGGWTGAIVPGELSTESPYGALGATGLMKDLPEHTTAGGMLYVFALPETARSRAR